MKCIFVSSFTWKITSLFRSDVFGLKLSMSYWYKEIGVEPNVEMIRAAEIKATSAGYNNPTLSSFLRSPPSSRRSNGRMAFKWEVV